MQPFASSSHSSTCWPSLLTVKDFSISIAELSVLSKKKVDKNRTYNHQTLQIPSESVSKCYNVKNMTRARWLQAV